VFAENTSPNVKMFNSLLAVVIYIFRKLLMHKKLEIEFLSTLSWLPNLAFPWRREKDYYILSLWGEAPLELNSVLNFMISSSRFG